MSLLNQNQLINNIKDLIKHSNNLDKTNKVLYKLYKEICKKIENKKIYSIDDLSSVILDNIDECIKEEQDYKIKVVYTLLKTIIYNTLKTKSKDNNIGSLL